MSTINSGDSSDRRTAGSLHRDGSADWQRVTNDLPKLGDVCWLWDGKMIWLGGREMVDSEQWMWGNSYGHVWHNGVKWDADIETDDDYKPTHWLALPNPPNDKLTDAGTQA